MTPEWKEQNWELKKTSSLRVLTILRNITIIILLEMEHTFWGINHQMSEQEGPDIIYSKAATWQIRKQKSRRLTGSLNFVALGEGRAVRTVFISWGCHIKVPKSGWLKTTKMYCLMVLEARSLKWRCHKVGPFLSAVRENLFHISLLAWTRFHVPHSSACRWYSLSSLCSHLCPNFLFL